MEEELRKTIEELTEKLNATELKISKQEEQAKPGPATVIYQTKPEKSLRKFREGDDVDDWIETTQSYISRLKKESERVDMILNFLDKSPYTEVRFRINRSKATSAELFQILKKVYGEKDTWTHMQQQFFSRQQKVGESVDEYAHVLIEMILKMEKINPSLLHNVDKLLRERFAEGIHEVSLRREMKRLNKERGDLEFHELRDEANDWMKAEESKTGMDVVTHEAVCTGNDIETSKLDSIMQIIQEQQKQLKKIEEHMYNKPQQYHAVPTSTQQYPAAPPSSTQQYRGVIHRSNYHGSRRSGEKDFTQTSSPAPAEYSSRRNHRALHRGNYRGSSTSRGQNYHTQTSRPTSDGHIDPAKYPGQYHQYQTLYQDPIICNYCNEPNHLERFCIKKRRDQRQNSTNYSHST